MAGCRVDASASHPLDSASASKRATLAYQGPIASCLLAPLLPFVSRSPAGCRIACCPMVIVVVDVVRCAVAIIVDFAVRASASRHLSSRSCRMRPSSLLSPAGCCVASLRTASASRRAATSRLAVSLPSPMHRRLRRCRDCDCHPCHIPSSWRHRPCRRCR